MLMRAAPRCRVRRRNTIWGREAHIFYQYFRRHDVTLLIAQKASPADVYRAVVCSKEEPVPFRYR